MSSWRVAPAIKVLFTEANLRAPSRSKAHDGTIGDQAHAARTSDHNPAADGYVYAGDLTDDDAAGIDCRALASQIVARKDRRVKYLISEGRMVSSYPVMKDGKVAHPAWTWRTYTGTNGHFKHLHVSVLPKWRNDTSPWWDAPAAAPQEEDDMKTECYRDGTDLVLFSPVGRRRIETAEELKYWRDSGRLGKETDLKSDPMLAQYVAKLPWTEPAR